MKKIIIILMSIFIILILGACSAPGFNNVQLIEAPDIIEDVESGMFENTLEGLKKYFQTKGFVAGESQKMSAELIEAEDGYKYKFSYKGVNISIELYEYDTTKLNDKAKDIIYKVNQEGNITIQNITANAVMSENNKYLMVYTKNKENDENIKRQENIIDSFKKFL